MNFLIRGPKTDSNNAVRQHFAAIHSFRVNQQRRLIFRWDGELGEANGVYLDDHS
ncbi:killer protein [Ochrobactrum cytisi]|nr:killer protein [Brucella cytisi]